MILLFTPYTYLFLSLYSFFLLSLISISSFYTYWLFIELMTLLLMGLSYTLFTNSVSFLMVYFLVQSLSSFVILVGYLFESVSLFTFAVLLKLGMFPFFSWYMLSVNRFPNFVFWLTGTIHNLPVLIMITIFSLGLLETLMWFVIMVTIIVSALFIFFTYDFRWLLVASSVGNNSWFILSQQCHLVFLFIFMVTYSFFLGCLLSSFNEFSKPSSIYSYSPLPWTFYLLCISGLPPFPLFFLNAYTIYFLFIEDVYETIEWYFIAFFLVANALLVAGYIRYLMKHQVYSFGSPAHILF